MKNRAESVKELKRLVNRLKRGGPKPVFLESDNPLEQLIFAVLVENNNPPRARAATQLLVAETVDYNDLRVSTAQELARLVAAELPDAEDRTTVLIQVLNAVYERENAVTLESLKPRTKKDIHAYLEALDGMTPFVLATTMLYGFGEHNMPVDEDILEILKKDAIIDEAAGAVETEAFLKRQISAGDSALFAALLKRYASQKMARATRDKKYRQKKKTLRRRTASRR